MQTWPQIKEKEGDKNFIFDFTKNVVAYLETEE